MKLYMKQKVFSWTDRFTVYDEYGEEQFYVQGEIFSWGKKLHILDGNESEAAFIHQKVLSFLPRYFINRGGEDIAEVVKKIAFFHPKYEVGGMNWTVDGNFFEHEYVIEKRGETLATVSKKWMSWGDSYEIDILPGEDVVRALAVVLVIDACMEAETRQ